MLEDNSSLEPGGVELDMSEEEWFHQAMEVAMAGSGDEPTLSEVLNGDEQLEWSDAIDAELTQIEKVNAWVPVIPPPNTNIIPSHYSAVNVTWLAMFPITRLG